MDDKYLEHHGVKGMRWGVRRYQNDDGTLTPQGRTRMLENAKKYERKANISVAENYFAKSRRARLIQKAKEARAEVKKSDAIIRKLNAKKIDKDELIKKKKMSAMKKMTDEELEEYVAAQEKRKKLEKRFTDLDTEDAGDDARKFERIKSKKLEDMSDDELNYIVNKIENRNKLEKRYDDIKISELDSGTTSKSKPTFNDVKNKTLKDMTDDELEVYVTSVERRKNLEERYSKLFTKEMSTGKKFIAGLSNTLILQPMEDIGKQISKSVMTKVTNEYIFPRIGLDSDEYKVFANNKKK